MKKNLLLLLSMVLLAACGGGYNQPDIDNYTKGPEFTLKVTGPLTVSVTSQNDQNIRFDWGDGQTTSNTNHPTHRYASKGVYQVTGTLNMRQSSYAVTVEDPTKCYITGIVYNKVGKENKYYKAVLIDDDFFTTTWVNTDYTLLSRANLPYTYNFATPKYMSGLNEDEYYDIQVLWSDTKSGNGTQILKQRIQTSDIMKFPDKITRSSNNGDTQVTILFDWK